MNSVAAIEALADHWGKVALASVALVVGAVAVAIATAPSMADCETALTEARMMSDAAVLAGSERLANDAILLHRDAHATCRDAIYIHTGERIEAP